MTIRLPLGLAIVIANYLSFRISHLCGLSMVTSTRSLPLSVLVGDKGDRQECLSY
jgi:hypothetical protein